MVRCSLTHPLVLLPGLPHLTHVTSQPTLVTEEMNLSVSVWDPSEPHQSLGHRLISLCPPPPSSPLNHLTPAAESWCVSALMKTLGREAISHLIPSNTLDIFQHLEMAHRLVLFGVWRLVAPLLSGTENAKWFMWNCGNYKLYLVDFDIRWRGTVALTQVLGAVNHISLLVYLFIWT